MNIYQKHSDEMLKYLVSKLPNVPYHIAEEIAVHLANKTVILVEDAIKERDMQWKKEIRRQYKR